MTPHRALLHEDRGRGHTINYACPETSAGLQIAIGNVISGGGMRDLVKFREAACTCGVVLHSAVICGCRVVAAVDARFRPEHCEQVLVAPLPYLIDLSGTVLVTKPVVAQGKGGKAKAKALSWPRRQWNTQGKGTVLGAALSISCIPFHFGTEPGVSSEKDLRGGCSRLTDCGTPVASANLVDLSKARRLPRFALDQKGQPVGDILDLVHREVHLNLQAAEHFSSLSCLSLSHLISLSRLSLSHLICLISSLSLGSLYMRVQQKLLLAEPAVKVTPRELRGLCQRGFVSLAFSL